MSTISDALKKVQQQRFEGQPATHHGGASHGGGNHDRPVVAQGEGRLLFPSILAGVAIMFALLFYFLGRHGSTARYEDDFLATDVKPAAVEEPAVTPAPVAEPIPPAVVAPSAAGTPVEEAGSPPPPPVTTKVERPVLGGIFYAERNPVAIINGSSLKEGETSGSWRIVKIQPLSVELKSEDETIELRMK